MTELYGESRQPGAEAGRRLEAEEDAAVPGDEEGLERGGLPGRSRPLVPGDGVRDEPRLAARPRKAHREVDVLQICEVRRLETTDSSDASDKPETTKSRVKGDGDGDREAA